MDEGPGDAAAEFWKFSLDFYGRPGVAELCVGLQDAYGVDVNLLLLCLWHGGLADDEIRRADDAVAEWREGVVGPLRAARRFLKVATPPEAGELRQIVLGAELEAERIGQRLLTAAVGRPLARRDGVGRALAFYLRAKAVPPDEAERAVSALLRALSS